MSSIFRSAQSLLNTRHSIPHSPFPIPLDRDSPTAASRQTVSRQNLLNRQGFHQIPAETLKELTRIGFQK